MKHEISWKFHSPDDVFAQLFGGRDVFSLFGKYKAAIL